MKISQKIALGFGLFMLLVALIMVLNYNSQVQIQETGNDINTLYTPSIILLEEINRSMAKIDAHMEHVTFFQTKEDAPERVELIYILESGLPEKLSRLDSISKKWDDENRTLKAELKSDVSSLFETCWNILTIVPNFEAYDVPQNNLLVRDYYLIGGAMQVYPEQIEDKLDVLMVNFRNKLEQANNELAEYSESHNYRALFLIVAVFAIGLLISLFVIRSIIRPINNLKQTVLSLGRGVYPKNDWKLSKDEIGEMTMAVNSLVEGLKKTKEFTVEVGKGNFDTDFEPMSGEDELGHALIRMRSELYNNERLLEKKVEERTQEMVLERERATKLYQDLNDSIEYAKRIQTSFLSSKPKVLGYFKDAFIIYKPKDQVSGDFFWARTTGEKVLLAAVDCTGHGVPGAFVSMVGNNVLNQISKVYTNPASILNNLHTLSSKILKKGREDELRDGMDIGLTLIDQKNLKLEYAGAHNTCYVIRNKNLYQLKGDRFSIGSNQAYLHAYTSQVFDLQKGDALYLFSDGYADQFGGPKNKKFLIKRFREKLMEISEFDMQRQEMLLEQTLKEWQGDNEQVDDILVIGVRI